MNAKVVQPIADRALIRIRHKQDVGAGSIGSEGNASAGCNERAPRLQSGKPASFGRDDGEHAAEHNAGQAEALGSREVEASFGS